MAKKSKKLSKQPEQVYQFKFAQVGIVPQIWRRVHLPPDYTFGDLHLAIQATMGWDDYHLHEFKVPNPRTGVLQRIGDSSEEIDDFYGTSALSEDKAKIADYFSPENKLAVYTYDFGDDLQVKVRFERVLPAKEGVKYPVCTAGKRAAIPEDSGGVWGYEELLEILKDSEHEDYEGTLEWLGVEFDPEHFDPKEVVFP
ncbi:MAG: plasmid pRiA4b ORF-3 family protein [Methanosarcinaceae archaeon]|nr:plasmid pRiA4b ORF-3 family protein [Methanosarcinaceae archaeon]